MMDDREIREVAELACLRLTSRELGSLSQELDRILAHVEHLNQVDTRSVEPTFHPIRDLINVFRPDSPEPGLLQEDFLALPAQVEDPYLKVQGLRDDLEGREP